MIIFCPKEKFIEIGRSFGFAKVKPARESKSGAYRSATSSIKDRIKVKDQSGSHVYRIYCRDNKKEDEEQISRELVKETLHSKTNDYRKLANIVFDKKTELMYHEDETYDMDVDTYSYCDQALKLFELFCTCYHTDHVDCIIQDQLEQLHANKIGIHGNLYFIPAPSNGHRNLQRLDLLEDYISAVSAENLNTGYGAISNSMFVVDDEKQRSKMTDEFYRNYKKELEFYQDRIQHFIENGCDSQAIIERWMQKIDTLKAKKTAYESALRKELNDLDQDFQFLQVQAGELRIRKLKGQTSLLKDAA